MISSCSRTWVIWRSGWVRRWSPPVMRACSVRPARCRSNPRAWVIDGRTGRPRWSILRHSAIAPRIGLAMARVLGVCPTAQGLMRSTVSPSRSWPARTTMTAIYGVILHGLRRGHRPEPGRGQAPIWTAGDRARRSRPAAHVRDVDGERELKPCAERLLSLRIGEEILKRGLMPVLSFRDRNAARFLRLQSIAEPPAALALTP